LIVYKADHKYDPATI